MNEIDRIICEEAVKNIPLNEPLTIDMREVTVKDFLPDFTDEEVRYIMSLYKGDMRSGLE